MHVLSLPSISLVIDLKTNSTRIIPDRKSLTSNKTGVYAQRGALMRSLPQWKSDIYYMP
jgi:hypothetical protein